MKATSFALSLAVFLPGLSCRTDAALTTYGPDANTQYLFHFDEAAGSSVAANAGATGFSAVSYSGNTYAGDGLNQPTVTNVLGATGYGGFGNAANVSANNLGLGVDRDASGAFMMGDNAPVSPDQFLDHSTIFGAGNVFTLDAMVNVPSITSGNRHIVSTDSNAGNADRGLQFRITGDGRLEFNYIGVNTSSVFAPIPTTGDHAFVANEWFHVALSYDGANASFYWTRVNPSFTAANPVGTPVAEGVDLNDDMLLVIGNEGRATGTPASAEGLVGLIDEVRISNVVRTAGQFIFVPEPSAAVLGGMGLLALLRRRTRR